MTTKNNQFALIQKNISDAVISRIDGLQKEGLVIPPNYSPANAIKSAWFKIQEAQDKDYRPALQVCKPDSIANALLNMAIQGLSPAKTQCYFIVYGNELQLTRSYFGTQAVIKRVSGVKDIWANVIYKGDEFNYENRNGKDYLVSHKTKLENRDNEIIGAYAIIETEDGDMPMTVMTRKEIEASWSQAKTDKVQKKFPQEMAKRTVINRAAKSYINTSDDSDILIDSINKTTKNEYEEDERINKDKAVDVEAEVQENANSVEFPEPSEVETEETPYDPNTGEAVDVEAEAPKAEEEPKEAPMKGRWDI